MSLDCCSAGWIEVRRAGASVSADRGAAAAHAASWERRTMAARASRAGRLGRGRRPRGSFRSSTSRAAACRSGPVSEAHVDAGGMEGDRQADRRIHGGPSRSPLWPSRCWPRCAARDTRSRPAARARTSRVEGLDWRRVVPGVRLRLGDEALIEVTSYTTPCWKNSAGSATASPDRMAPGAASGREPRLRPRAAARPVAHGRCNELIEETAAERVRRQQPKTFRWPRDFA